jgi:probable rRNA maturation factor
MQLKIQTNPRFPAVSDEGAGWLGFLRELAAEIGPAEHWVEVSFSDDETLRALNRDYRGKDRPTDVLSWHYGSDTDGLAGGEQDPEGEIVISVETAERQATDAGHSVAEELSVLVIHGLFHILGFDHEEDEEAAEMEAAEAPYRQRLSRYFDSSVERS